MVPAARPAARPTTSQGAGGQAAPPAALSIAAASSRPASPRRRPRVQRHRHRGEQEEDPDDVVPRLPRLVGERRHAQRDRPQRQRPRRHPVGPADAPAGDQAADEPAEVEQRREHVPAERQHPDRVEDFAVRRVEPGEELRRDEVQVDRVAALEEPGRERPVVPGASRSRSSPSTAASSPRRRSGRAAISRDHQRDQRSPAVLPPAAVPSEGGLHAPATCRCGCGSLPPDAPQQPPQPQAHHRDHDAGTAPA